jgi:hypothetical protein
MSNAIYTSACSVKQGDHVLLRGNGNCPLKHEVIHSNILFMKGRSVWVPFTVTVTTKRLKVNPNPNIKAEDEYIYDSYHKTEYKLVKTPGTFKWSIEYETGANKHPGTKQQTKTHILPLMQTVMVVN